MIAGFLPLILILTAFLSLPAGEEMTARNVRFVEYPGFPDEIGRAHV